MALITPIEFKGISLPEAYFRIVYIALDKDQDSLCAQWQIHSNSDKKGCIDMYSITTPYIKDEDLFVTAFNALREKFPTAKDIK